MALYITAKAIIVIEVKPQTYTERCLSPDAVQAAFSQAGKEEKNRSLDYTVSYIVAEKDSKVWWQYSFLAALILVYALKFYHQILPWLLLHYYCLSCPILSFFFGGGHAVINSLDACCPWLYEVKFGLF